MMCDLHYSAQSPVISIKIHLKSILNMPMFNIALFTFLAHFAGTLQKWSFCISGLRGSVSRVREEYQKSIGFCI